MLLIGFNTFNRTIMELKRAKAPAGSEQVAELLIVPLWN